MSNYLTDDDPAIEQHEVADTDGDTFATLTYATPRRAPWTTFSTWRVDFPNGDQVSGDAANEVARLLMAEVDGTVSGAGTTQDDQTDALLETVVWDDHGGAARITVRGVRVWFDHATDEGDDVVLMADDDTRAGVVEDAPFDAARLMDEVRHARRQARGGA